MRLVFISKLMSRYNVRSNSYINIPKSIPPIQEKLYNSILQDYQSNLLYIQNLDQVDIKEDLQGLSLFHGHKPLFQQLFHHYSG